MVVINELVRTLYMYVYNCNLAKMPHNSEISKRAMHLKQSKKIRTILQLNNWWGSLLALDVILKDSNT